MILGDNQHLGISQPVGLPYDARRRHVYIVGGTGTGKTTLIKTQALADIRAGRGLAVIDPHGDLATELRAQVPEDRQADLIYFDPADEACQLGLNLLKLPPALEGADLDRAKDLRTEALISVLRKVFKTDGYDVGHRVEYVLRNTIQTSFSVIEPNLFTLFKLLNDRSFNRTIVRHLKNPYLKLFWKNEIGLAGPMQKVKMQAGVTAKIGRFIFSHSVKQAFNRPNDECLDMAQLINKQQILICNFAKGSLGEDASQLFCATTLAEIQLAILEQVKLPVDQRPDFYLYVDEFQHFATNGFIELLAEARKIRPQFSDGSAEFAAAD